MAIFNRNKLPLSFLATLTLAMFLIFTGCNDDDDPMGPEEPTEQPDIIEVQPDSGAVGTEVVIYGSGFSATPSDNEVTFNGTEAPVHRASPDSLHTEVPENATDGPIEVTVAGETAVGPDFNVIESDTSDTTAMK